MRNEMRKAKSDYKGKFRIWVEYCYWPGTFNPPKSGLLADECGEYIIFDSYDDAAEWIDDNTGGTYYLHHGEMGRPTYKIVEA